MHRIRCEVEKIISALSVTIAKEKLEKFLIFLQPLIYFDSDIAKIYYRKQSIVEKPNNVLYSLATKLIFATIQNC